MLNFKDVAETAASERRVGYDLVGPVVHRWLLALQQHHHYLDDGDTKFLFCARAGVRIAKLYQIFQNAFPGAAAVEPDLFWISRVSVAKGVYATPTAGPAATAAIVREYKNQPLSDLVNGLLRHNPHVLDQLDLSNSGLRAHGFNFPGWMTVKGPVQEALSAYLRSCTAAFEEYVRETLDGKKRAVLIDSGWQGSSQSLMAKAFPEIGWKGVYFGRILTATHDPLIANDVIGLLFEGERYNPTQPETAFVRHRHLIESLLEPNGPSIEEIPAGPFADAAQKLIASNLSEAPDVVLDALYLQVEQYLRDHAALPMSEIIARHQRAMPELAKKIITPVRADVEALSIKDRSADFGKALKVPVLRVSNPDDLDDKEHRVSVALWQEGQIALEYGVGIALDMQRRLNDLTGDASYFDPAGTTAADASVAEQPEGTRSKVAIITRTKNRPIMLRRAAESVANQTFADYTWVVVNDGGDEGAVREVLENCRVDRRRIRLVSNRESLGMEAASNCGIRACMSDFVVIHDDDDSWNAQFLAKAIGFLTSGRGARYGGAITHSVYVSEEIRGDDIIERARFPYHDWVRNVQLAEMACDNFFPPIAFVFRRSLWEKVGGYNEKLPVLGDWFFNLEFLLHADIGVIHEPLAYYHHRDTVSGRSGNYANSVIGGQLKHEEFAAVARNEFLRRHAHETTAALSVVLGYMTKDLRGKVGSKASGGAVDWDQLDLYWTAANVNKVAADRFYGLHLFARKWLGKKPLTVGPEAGWSEVIAAVVQLNARIPEPPDFDEHAYLLANVDVAAAVESRAVRSGYTHYICHGRVEGRGRPRRVLS